jgi:hypothetical protein
MKVSSKNQTKSYVDYMSETQNYESISSWYTLIPLTYKELYSDQIKITYGAQQRRPTAHTKNQKCM